MQVLSLGAIYAIAYLELKLALALLDYVEGLPTAQDRALFGICLYIATRINEACSLHNPAYR